MVELMNHGYEVIRKIFTPEETDSFRQAISETLDRTASALRAPFEASCPDAAIDSRLDQIAQRDRMYGFALFQAALVDSHRDPRIDALAVHPRLTEIIAERLYPMARTGQTIRARASVSTFSSARSPWHQDVVRVTENGCGTVRLACWIPLTDIDENGGALEIIPGAWPAPLPHVENEGRFSISEQDLPVHRETVSLESGDVLLLNRFTPHRSLPAAHGRTRWAVVMWVKAS